MLDRLCFQSEFSFTPNDFKNCYDINMIKQSTTGVCSIEVSFQNSSEKLQPCQEVHEDANGITTTSNHEVELVKFEYPVIGQVYLDRVDIYNPILHHPTASFIHLCSLTPLPICPIDYISLATHSCTNKQI
jgi:hypothetical protein